MRKTRYVALTASTGVLFILQYTLTGTADSNTKPDYVQEREPEHNYCFKMPITNKNAPGGGDSPIKITGVLVGNFENNP